MDPHQGRRKRERPRGSANMTKSEGWVEASGNRRSEDIENILMYPPNHTILTIIFKTEIIIFKRRSPISY